MVSDSIVNANSSKDFGKKKRANRSAKLKQCKLDARREQWLSQVKNKGVKEEVIGGNGNGNGNGNGGGEFNGRVIETRKKGAATTAIPPCCKGIEVRNVSVEEIHNHDSDSESSSLTSSPTSSVNGGGNGYGGSSSSSSSSSSGSSRESSSSFGSGGCCSGSITEEEEGGGGGEFDGDDGCLDDWEAVADALVGAAASDKQGHEGDSDQAREKVAIFGSDSESVARQTKDQNGHLDSEKGKSESMGISGRDRVNTRAWRPDDVSRPQNLPNLSKQRSFPASSERLSWVHNKMPPCVPSSCPICCEDLDLTDSSFLPCPCGFHLCLFCHKRILEDDGRCPGCRKPYASDLAEQETSVSGGNLTIRLARSSSMFSRV